MGSDGRKRRKGRIPDIETEPRYKKLRSIWWDQEYRWLTPKEISQLSGIPKRSIHRYLPEMVDNGELQGWGKTSKKISYYRPVNFYSEYSSGVLPFLLEKTRNTISIPIDPYIWATLSNFPSLTKFTSSDEENLKKGLGKIHEGLEILHEIRKSHFKQLYEEGINELEQKVRNEEIQPEDILQFFDNYVESPLIVSMTFHPTIPDDMMSKMRISDIKRPILPNILNFIKRDLEIKSELLSAKLKCEGCSEKRIENKLRGYGLTKDNIHTRAIEDLRKILLRLFSDIMEKGIKTKISELNKIKSKISTNPKKGNADFIRWFQNNEEFLQRFSNGFQKSKRGDSPLNKVLSEENLQKIGVKDMEKYIDISTLDIVEKSIISNKQDDYKSYCEYFIELFEVAEGSFKLLRRVIKDADEETIILLIDNYGQRQGVLSPLRNLKELGYEPFISF